MPYIRTIYNTPIDLNCSVSKETHGQSIFSIVRREFFQVYNDVISGTFDYTGYSFGRMFGSGLTQLPGFYLVINRLSTKLYLGCTHNLGQRKGEYNNNFSNRDSLYASMREDLSQYRRDSFYYIPLCAITRSCFLNVNASVDITNFLQDYVERPLLTELLNDASSMRQNIYNVQTGNTFEVGNQFGAQGGGSPKQAVAFRNEFAWESVSLAARSFGFTNRALRSHRDQERFVNISQENFESFAGIKITEENFAEIQEQYSARFAQIRATFLRGRSNSSNN